MRTRSSVTVVFALCAVLSTAQAEEAVPSDIAITEMGSGRLFTSRDGLTLYTFKQDREQPGTSMCIEECAVQWPPVLATAETEPMGSWSTITRDDGSKQWAYKGQPVYTFIKDTHAGATVGLSAAGFYRANFWDVLYEPMETPPNIVIQATMRGQILADLQGHTIYTQSEAACDATCMKPWHPVEAPWLAQPIGAQWSIVQRDDGLRQWAYKGKPLFTYTGDFKSQETNGEDATGGWSVAILHEAPAIPEWVTFQETDIGPVMATDDRMTLYILVTDPEKIQRETCDDACVAKNWNLVLAEDDDRPIDNWTIVALEDGRRHWHYLGFPVYTFKRDGMPGDIFGDKFGTGSEIRGGWNAILQETLILKLSS